jgi:chemotaxis protein MotA
MLTMSMDDPYQVEECMQRQLRKHHAELHARAAALQSIADAAPALGIVAAVLRVVKTMGSINQPVEILGAMIGGALVGTFLGVYIAYGFVGPLPRK